MSPQTAWILQEEVVPRLRSAVPQLVHCIGAEDHEELVQDGALMAARMMDRYEHQGKQVTPGNISFYITAHLKSGRRAMGTRSADVMGSATQLNGSSRLHSMHEVVAEVEGDEIFEIQDVISTDQEDPSIVAARRMDWQVLLEKLSDLEMRLIEYLGTESTLKGAARRFNISRFKLLQVQRKIAEKIIEYMGADVLREICRLPNWRINLDTERETVLCRHERRVA